MRLSQLQMSLFLKELDAHEDVGVAKTLRADDVSGRLSAVDWNFTSSDESGTIHAIHPYPAKFISEIPRTLIRELGVLPDSGVLDPFCGCGTTLAVAQEFGVHSIGIDLNPIACLVSRVKTSVLPPTLLQAAKQVAHTASTSGPCAVPSLPNLGHWFDDSVQQAVAALVEAISRCDDRSIREHMQVALSSILVRVSRQESDTRYAAIEKSVSSRTVFEQFLQACSKLYRSKECLDIHARATVLESDILDITPEQVSQKVSLIITSPPYPNAYEYWLYHKYRMWWLGYDPLAVKEKEIGARAHYFKKHHATYEEFIEQMRQVLRLSHEILMPGGYACFVLGRSRIHGVDFDNAAMIEAVAYDEGFNPLIRLARAIAPARKSFNLSHARIKTEEIVVLRKGRA